MAGFHAGGWHTLAIGTPYMFFPALGAWAAERRRGARVLQSLDVRFRVNRWWLVGLLGPLAVVALTFAFDLAIPGVHPIHSAVDLIPKDLAIAPEKLARAKEKLARYPLWELVPIQALEAIGAGASINAVVAFGEELGWRGYLQRAFARLGFWRSSCLVGLFWGPWHAAVVLQGYNYPQHPVIGVAMMTVMTVLLSPLFAAVRYGGGSVVASSIAHGTFNACAGFALFVTGGSDLTKGVTGLAGICALAVANLALLVTRSTPAWTLRPSTARSVGD